MNGARTAFVLSEAERSAAKKGQFVRVPLGMAVEMRDGSLAESALVGWVDGELRAFANLCRHQAIALDARAADEDDGVMAEDRIHLFCHAHGAIYRPTDGACVTGPCVGARLFAFRAEETSDGVALWL
ncbi:MAG: Rieske 2Fe-2S domain-containing protein [Polyangiaceae bacterium]